MYKFSEILDLVIFIPPCTTTGNFVHYINLVTLRVNRAIVPDYTPIIRKEVSQSIIKSAGNAIESCKNW